MDTYSSNQMNIINATYFYNRGSNDSNTPTFVEKEFSTGIIFDTIRESISNQYEHTFGAKPDYRILNSLVDGFVLFNLHKNKYMLKNKDELLKYVKNPSISLQETTYFMDIFLYNQRPKFLSSNEHEYIRSCGDLDGYDDYDNDEDDHDISNLLNSIENTVSVITNTFSNLTSN
jgi:hypothetical protein